MTWYLRREWIDQEDGIENVLIHYTWSLPGDWPVWERNHNVRVLLDAGGFPRRRKKVLSMPRGLWDDAGNYTTDFRLHWFYEVFQHGRQWTTDLESADVVSRELEFYDDQNWVTHLCIYWSVYDWEAPIYSPMEDPRFPGDSDFRSTRYYEYEDKERFHYSKAQMLNALPTPHRWQARMWAPVGARVVQQYHIGRLYPPEERYETWLGPDGPSEPSGNYWVHEF